ncbi:MAG: sulfurtransferase TusA family protein [Burkholderiaceae bacterium]
MADTKTIQPHVTLDVTGTTCPGPVLGVRKVISELAEGEVLLLLSDCPGTRDDLEAWSAHTGNALLRSERVREGVTGYYVQRGRRAERAADVVLDMRGSVCPGPIIEARKMLASMPVGSVLKMASNCPGAKADVADWARLTGVELLDTVELGDHEWEFYLRREG